MSTVYGPTVYGLQCFGAIELARVLLTALGSYGDVHPFVGLGAAMRARGHHVAVISNPHFASVIESAGLEPVSLGSAEEYDELVHRSEMWHPLRGPMQVLRTCIAEYTESLFALISTHYRPGETILGAHPLDLASRIYQERYGAPLASIHLAPLAAYEALSRINR